MHKATVLSSEHQKRTPDQAFAELSQRVETLVDRGEVAVVVYDLDATLFDNRPRVLKILESTLAMPEAADLPAELVGSIRGIKRNALHYRLSDTLMDHGVQDQELIDWFQDEWFKRFFTNEYVLFDEPTAGAVDFVQKMHALGSCSVYLTGRDTPGMREGTHESLVKWGFPEPNGERCHLITKPTFEQPDPEFKRDAIEQIKARQRGGNFRQRAEAAQCCGACLLRSTRLLPRYNA